MIVSQALRGTVRLDLYEAGVTSLKKGAIPGRDMTSEAAIVKMMKLLARKVPYEKFGREFSRSLAGEIS